MKKLCILFIAPTLGLLSACNSADSEEASADKIAQIYTSGDLGKTRRMLALAFEAGEKNAEISLIAAKVALARGDGFGAETNLMAARKAGKKASTIDPLMAEAFALQGKFEEALSLAEDSGNKTAILHVTGKQLWSENRAWHAREAWEEAYKMSPDNHRLALDLSKARSYLGLFPEARSAIVTVQKSQPKNIIASLAMGDIEMRARKFGAAAAAYNGALKIAPGNAAALIGNAQALYGAKKWKAAKKAIIAMPRDIATKAQAQLLAGKISMQLNDHKSARTHFSNARNLVDGDTQAQFLLGKLHLKNGRPYKAISLIEAAATARPDLPEHHAALIRAYREAGDERSAQMRLAKVPESLKDAKELRGL